MTLPSKLPRLLHRGLVLKARSRAFSLSTRVYSSQKDREQLTDPPRGNPAISGRGPPEPPQDEAANLRDNAQAATYLGTTKRLPEFALNDKVVLVTGAARGLGLVQAEALLEAGAHGMCSLSTRVKDGS